MLSLTLNEMAVISGLLTVDNFHLHSPHLLAVLHPTRMDYSGCNWMAKVF
jgi:hypothetical protein